MANNETDGYNNERVNGIEYAHQSNSLATTNYSKTHHKIIIGDSREMNAVKSDSIDLVVTSPPYPMIEMWDTTFSSLNSKIEEALENENGERSFELMHTELDKVWMQCYRVLKQGGIACINIGDATRTIGGDFKLYPNHVRIASKAMDLGFSVLPEILWRKESNKPNKFMGSGMLPTGAYVTQEHEYILILRKGPKRRFSSEEERANRFESAFFWEERNTWYSDVWTGLKGERQGLNSGDLRKRSAAFPFELPYRLINMYSAKEDIVLDPFLGTGTTVVAAVMSGRNSIGIETEASFSSIIKSRIIDSVRFSYDYISQRKNKHREFVKQRKSDGKEIKYENENYGFPVMTKQEVRIKFPEVKNVFHTSESAFEADYI